MNTLDEIIEVVMAFKQGKKIQFSNRRFIEWRDAGDNPTWDFNLNIYRVKPAEKKKVKMWQFLIRDRESGNYSATGLFYSSLERAREDWDDDICEVIMAIQGTEIEVEE